MTQMRLGPLHNPVILDKMATVKKKAIKPKSKKTPASKTSNQEIYCTLPASLRSLLEVFLGRRHEFSHMKVLPGGEAGIYILACRILMARGYAWMTGFESELLRNSDVLDFLAWLKSREKQNESQVTLLSRTPSALNLASRSLSFLEELLLDPQGPRGDLLKTGTELWEALWVLQCLTPQDRKTLLQEIAVKSALPDLLYLSLCPLNTWPVAGVALHQLRYMIIADKGEMGARAVRECLGLGLRPVVIFSEDDDAKSLSVRLGSEAGGFTVGIPGGFRSAYADAPKILAALQTEYEIQFGSTWREQWGRSALYPGYGPLAENAAAIFLFRTHGLAFVGPTHDVVEKVGDKRFFRELAASIDPGIVTRGVRIEAGLSTEPLQETLQKIRKHISASPKSNNNSLQLPIRIKAANGGGGRGQAVLRKIDDLASATSRVLQEIQSNGWEPGLLLEENLERTIHLEVQILRDRFGNTRHFGMRDCTEQRASQKIQEEAPPAILRSTPMLQKRMEELAVQIAEKAGYFGAGTVELMYHQGKFYFLEMNTRIQVEHPVTEMTYQIRRPGDCLEPLNLVQWQMRLARGEALDFKQEDIVNTHVGREFRINAESWRDDLKDPRDGKKGLFLPNSGLFERFEIPSPQDIKKAIAKGKIEGISGKEVDDVQIRLDSGFEVGDSLVNKDPTFAKLIISLRAAAGHEKKSYELLRLVCIYTLKHCFIEGYQVRPDGKPLRDQKFMNNLSAHVEILNDEILKTHCAQAFQKLNRSSKRHVGWVVESLRSH